MASYNVIDHIFQSLEEPMNLGMKSNNEKRALTYTIENMVIKSNLKTELDLYRITKVMKNCDFKSSRFPGVFLRFTLPKCVIILFSNGKIVITGLKKFFDIKITLYKLIDSLNSKEELALKIEKKAIQHEIVNIVITADYNEGIDLDKAAIKLENAVYDPEVFPGLIYNNDEPVKSVFLIFTSGKVVLTGLKSTERIEETLVNMGKILKREKLFK